MTTRFLFEEKLLDKMSEEKRRISLSDVCRETGISKNALSNLSKKTLSGINFSTLEALCHYFDCKPGDLIVLESDNGASPKKHPQPLKEEVAP